MREIRIRELNLTEARQALDVGLNEAFMAGESRVQVLHGIGSGRLRKMTAELVRDCGFGRIVPQLVNENPGVTLVDLEPPSRETLRLLRSSAGPGAADPHGRAQQR